MPQGAGNSGKVYLDFVMHLCVLQQGVTMWRQAKCPPYTLKANSTLLFPHALPQVKLSNARGVVPNYLHVLQISYAWSKSLDTFICKNHLQEQHNQLQGSDIKRHKCLELLDQRQY